MECDAAQDLPVVVDISSDEGSPPILVSSDHFGWVGELLYEDSAAEEEEEEEADDDVIVIGEFGPLDKSRKRKLEGGDDRDYVDDDDECLVLDGDPDKLLVAVEAVKGNDDGSDSDDLLFVGEKGQVACRDYPHPRHECVKFPFNTTAHEKHCNLCHCYVCDSCAPCIYWGTGMSNSDHCHATDKDGYWKISRNDLKLVKSAGQNAFGIDNGTAQIVIPLPAQTLHHGRMPPAASATPQNLVSQQMTAHQAGQTIIPGSTLIPTNPTPQNLFPKPAIYHPPSKTSHYGNTTSSANSFLERRPILQRCSSSVAYHSSDHIYSGVRKQQSGNLKVGPELHFAPGRLSHPINVVRPDGHHVHASSVARFNKMGIVYRPAVHRAGYISNNTSRSPHVQCSGKFPKSTATNACHSKIPKQNRRACTDFPSDIQSGQLNATGPLQNMVHPQSSGFCHPISGMSADAEYASPIYQQIGDAHPQNLVVPPHHETETMNSAAVTQRHQPPIQQSNLHLPQEFNLGSETMNNNWWSENELPQGQISLEPPAAAVDMGILLFDFETPWDGVTRS